MNEISNELLFALVIGYTFIGLVIGWSIGDERATRRYFERR